MSINYCLSAPVSAGQALLSCFGQYCPSPVQHWTRLATLDCDGFCIPDCAGDTFIFVIFFNLAPSLRLCWLNEATSKASLDVV